MRFISRSEHGVDESQPGVHQSVLDAFVEDHPNVPPHVLEAFYGTDGNHDRGRRPNQTGARHPPDEEDDEEDIDTQLEEMIANEENGNVRHDAIEVPKSEGPFPPDIEALFRNTLQTLQDHDIVPENYGVTEDEWDSDGYPERETLAVGSRKKISIQLPVDIWLQRASLWAQGLDLMARFEVELD